MFVYKASLSLAICILLIVNSSISRHAKNITVYFLESESLTGRRRLYDI